MSAYGDVRDVEAFAAWQVRRTLLAGDRYGFTPSDLPDAYAEGVILVIELHGDWDAERCESFSAFLLTYLPKRLISWWRRELRQSGRGIWSGKTGESGIRSLERLSLEAYTETTRTDRSLISELPSSVTG